MSIELEISLDRLRDPQTAEAMAQLVLALGAQARAGVTKPSPKPPVSAPQRLQDQEPNPTVSAAAPAPVPRRYRVSKPRRERTGPSPKEIMALPNEERWAAYFTTLPEPSRRFLELLKEQGRLTVGEAVEALELSSRKAMGGLTGAMVRWAPRCGVVLPFQPSETEYGERCWVWTGKPKEA